MNAALGTVFLIYLNNSTIVSSFRALLKKPVSLLLGAVICN
jgi:hypothetical protein